ncbi:MAG: ORF6N domain-containing protein [Verrucomicrobia bacterium]|nr:MAG: ORF6N domain-containing protein [Verrucomicrobiota bacterium]
MSNQTTALIPAARIERRILLLRGEKVMLDSDLAELYGVETKTLNQAVKRNLERFPEDFMFQLSSEETNLILRSQIVTSSGKTPSKPSENNANLRSQIVTSSLGYGGRRYRPYVFTEQGVAMLSSVLASPKAIQVNIAIMRAFVQLRQMLSSNAGLARKLAALEGKYDKQFRVVFDAIRALMREKKQPKREIGFHTLMKQPAKVNGAKAKKL